MGTFYSIISATQGGWRHLSAEGRYMGAAAYGDMNRATNRCYLQLRQIFSFGADGFVHLNRSLANEHRSTFRHPYTPDLEEILGPPIAVKDVWNPDAVLRVEGIRHEPHTKARVDKGRSHAARFRRWPAPPRECVYPQYRIRPPGTYRRHGAECRSQYGLMERFDEEFYERNFGRHSRLHLWIPPAPGDAGATFSAAYSFALSAGALPGPPLQHAFYCGRGFSIAEWTRALNAAEDVEWTIFGNSAQSSGIETAADHPRMGLTLGRAKQVLQPG